MLTNAERCLAGNGIEAVGGTVSAAWAKGVFGRHAFSYRKRDHATWQ